MVGSPVAVWLPRSKRPTTRRHALAEQRICGAWPGSAVVGRLSNKQADAWASCRCEGHLITAELALQGS